MALIKRINHTSNIWLLGEHTDFEVVVRVGSPFINTEDITVTYPLKNAILPKTTTILLPQKLTNLLVQENSIMIHCQSVNGGSVGYGYPIDNDWSAATEIDIVFRSIDISNEENGTRVKLTADIELWS